MDPCLDMEDSEDTPPPPDTSVVGGGNRQESTHCPQVANGTVVPDAPLPVLRIALGTPDPDRPAVSEEGLCMASTTEQDETLGLAIE
ncbi:hypothetical protein SKAU_G00234090 [Synaphobranchus kaupii]|uniref:Uncharacterized protein n=1 Tax=Synaphobranchus kaupii TaxID=118154 RepID=A0A9Q1F698_SYNKA|nr:hypothetical protein SKAU_G00234090 [Synaphobranchus kaupii]